MPAHRPLEPTWAVAKGQRNQGMLMGGMGGPEKPIKPVDLSGQMRMWNRQKIYSIQQVTTLTTPRTLVEAMYEDT
jgi:hypothetical protein